MPIIPVPISSDNLPHFSLPSQYQPNPRKFEPGSQYHKCISFFPPGDLTGDIYSVTSKNGQTYYLSGKLAEEFKFRADAIVLKPKRNYEGPFQFLAERIEDGIRSDKEALKKEFPSGSSYKDKKNKVDIFFNFLKTHLLSLEDRLTDAIPWRLRNSNHQKFLKELIPQNEERNKFIREVSKREVELDILAVAEQNRWKRKNRYGYGSGQFSVPGLPGSINAIVDRIFNYANPSWKL